MAGNEAILC